MSAPSAVAPPRTAAADDRRFRLAALAPSEGWLTVVLHAVVLVAAAATVARVPLAPPVGDLALLTVGGLLVGLALAKLRAPDLLAHLFAFSTGVLASLALTAEHLSPVGNRLQRAEFLVAQVGDWYRAVATGQQISDPRLFAVVLGITVWLVAYTSAWVLYRRGWLATAMLLPAAIATINLGYMPSGGTLPLLVIVAAGCVLAARHALFQREQRWTRLRVPFPSRLPWRWVVAGVNLALVTALVGWTLPFSTRDDAFDAIWDKVRSPVEQASREWQDLLARFGANSDASGSYASFGDQFTLGGQLKLSDEPVMVLQTNLADGAYLAGHRYDESVVATQLVLEALGDAMLARLDAGLARHGDRLRELRRTIRRQETAHHRHGLALIAAWDDDTIPERLRACALRHRALAAAMISSGEPAMRPFALAPADLEADLDARLPRWARGDA